MFYRILILISLLGAMTLNVLAQGPRIMVVGDSISEGWPSTEPSFRLPLWDLMEARNLSFRFVGNRTGNYNGTTTSSSPITTGPALGWPASAQAHSSIAGIFASEYWFDQRFALSLVDIGPSNYPDAVLIHLGSNDMGNFGSATETRNYIGQIIDDIRYYLPGTPVFVAQVIPAGNSIPGTSYPAVSQLNALIPGLVASRNSATARAYLVDHSTGYPIADYNNAASFEPLANFVLNPDNIHPNLEGQAEMARRWLGPLEAVTFPPSVSILTPSHGTTAAVGGSLNVDLSVVAPRAVSRVELYANGTRVGSKTAAPFNFNVAVNDAGPLVLNALVFDTEFQEAVSRAVVVNPGEAALQSALADVAAWYRSDTLIELSSGRVRRWRDISGNNHHLFQRNPASRPIRSANRFRTHPGLVFSGSQYLTSYSGMPVDSSYSKLVVHTLADTASDNNLLSSATSPPGAHALWYSGDAKPNLYLFGSNPDPAVSYASSSINTELNEVTSLVSTFSRGNRNARLYQDNVLGVSATAYRRNSSGSFQVGAYASLPSLKGNVAEVMLFDRVLSAAERGALDRYITARYKAPPNNPPVLAALPIQHAHLGEAISIASTVNDPDAGQTFSYNISGLSGSTVNGAGVVSWTVPTNLPTGSYAGTLTVTDSGVPPASANALVRVVLYDPPLITSVQNMNGMCRLGWTGITGRTYSLESTTNLSSGVWSPAGTGGLNALVPGNHPWELFRVR